MQYRDSRSRCNSVIRDRALPSISVAGVALSEQPLWDNFSRARWSRGPFVRVLSAGSDILLPPYCARFFVVPFPRETREGFFRPVARQLLYSVFLWAMCDENVSLWPLPYAPAYLREKDIYIYVSRST